MAGVMCVIAIASACLAASAEAGVSYPVPYNVNPHEGTLEFWLRYPESTSTTIRPFYLRGEDGAMNVRAGFRDGSPAVQIRFNPRDKMLPVGAGGGPGTTLDLDEQRWAHLAFVWKGADVSYLYINGERRASRAHSFTFASLLGDLLGEDRAEQSGLFFPAQDHGGWVIDEFHLSSVAREAEELGFHGLIEPDAHTVILDRFEETFEDGGQRYTRPAVLLHGLGGRLGEATLVEGRFGHGLALAAIEADATE